MGEREVPMPGASEARGILLTQGRHCLNVGPCPSSPPTLSLHCSVVHLFVLEKD